jgi:hypothetical protein
MKAGITLIAIFIIVGIMAISGYVMNIVKLTECDFEAPYKAEVIRSVGIPIPIVGAIAGYMDIGR